MAALRCDIVDLLRQSNVSHGKPSCKAIAIKPPLESRARRATRRHPLSSATHLNREVSQPMLLTLRQASSATILLLSLASSHTALAQADAAPHKRLYSETAIAAEDIAAAQKAAQPAHKRILLEFGGNWCGDCYVLDGYFHQAANADLLARSFVVVHVDIGHMDHNTDIAAKYHVPITRGVPALAILDDHGKLLYAEKEKEFEHSSPEAVNTLLNRWKS